MVWQCRQDPQSIKCLLMDLRKSFSMKSMAMLRVRILSNVTYVISGVFYYVHFKQMDRQIHAQYGYVLTVTSELHG